MFRRWNTRARGAAAVLHELKADLVVARARLDTLLDFIRQHRGDSRYARDVGRSLDEIARKRLHRLYGHRSFEALVIAELGISRTTAHRWRAHAHTPATKPTKHERPPALPGPRVVPPEVLAEARALASRLRRRGARGVRVEVFEQDGEPMLRIELAAKHGRELA